MAWKGWEDYRPPATRQVNIERSLQGMRSQQLGENFEALIEISCMQYQIWGKANIEKTPEPFHVTGKQEQEGGGIIFKGHFEKPAQPDFKGTLAGGRSVCFEAKATESERMLKSRVNEEQEKQLNQHYRLGAVAFVLISFGMRGFYRIPWPVWHDMKRHFGRKYLIPADVEKYRVAQQNGVLLFLKGVK